MANWKNTTHIQRFGKQILNIRYALNKSQSDFGPVQRARLSEYERAIKNPTLDTIFHIASNYNLHPIFLLDFDISDLEQNKPIYDVPADVLPHLHFLSKYLI